MCILPQLRNYNLKIAVNTKLLQKENKYGNVQGYFLHKYDWIVW